MRCGVLQQPAEPISRSGLSAKLARHKIFRTTRLSKNLYTVVARPFPPPRGKGWGRGRFCVLCRRSSGLRLESPFHCLSLSFSACSAVRKAPRLRVGLSVAPCSPHSLWSSSFGAVRTHENSSGCVSPSAAARSSSPSACSPSPGPQRSPHRRGRPAGLSGRSSRVRASARRRSTA